ncbi:MAG: lysophospholipid acyltransferase family protein [Parvularculaceae bacterium]
MLKKILKSDTFRAALCPLITAYLWLVARTGAWRHDMPADTAALLDSGAAVILAFWHGRLMMVPAAWARRAPLSVIISQHRDGDLIARSVAPLGVGAIRGSTSKAAKKSGKGGAAAFRAALRELKSGRSVGVTPDGPRGPRARATAGVVRLARLSGAAIVPLSFSAAPARALGSWDRFLLAAPFARGVFVWGSPIRIPSSARSETDALRATIEKALNAAECAADAAAGRRSEPASAEDGAKRESHA